MDADQAVALAQAINETASAGSLENKTPGSRGPRVGGRNSQLGTEPGTKTGMGQKKLASNSKFADMKVEV